MEFWSVINFYFRSFAGIAYLQELNESLKDRFDVKSSLKQLKAKFLNMQKDEKEQTDKVCVLEHIKYFGSVDFLVFSLIKRAKSICPIWNKEEPFCVRNMHEFCIRSNTSNGILDMVTSTTTVSHHRRMH